MKHAFYFILKALFVLKIIKFVLTFWACRKKRLHYKDKVNFEIYDVKNLANKELQHKYCSISHELKATRLKFGQLIKRHKINIFL